MWILLIISLLICIYFSTIENYDTNISEKTKDKNIVDIFNSANIDDFNSANIDDNDKYKYKYNDIYTENNKSLDSNQIFESSDFRKRKMVIY